MKIDGVFSRDHIFTRLNGTFSRFLLDHGGRERERDRRGEKIEEVRGEEMERG